MPNPRFQPSEYSGAGLPLRRSCRCSCHVIGGIHCFPCCRYEAAADYALDNGKKKKKTSFKEDCKKATKDRKKWLDKMWKEPLFTQKRVDYEKKANAAGKKVDECATARSPAKAVLMARGVARVASDTGIKFKLPKDFQVGADIFKIDGDITKAFKVSSMEKVVDAGKNWGKKHKLSQALNYALVVDALKDAMVGTNAGFITLQVAAAVVDVVAGIVTVGGWAAAAPFVHGGIAAGQSVSVAAINANIQANEQLYAQALETYAAKAKTKMAKEEKAIAKKTAAATTAAAQRTTEAADATATAFTASSPSTAFGEEDAPGGRTLLWVGLAGVAVLGGLFLFSSSRSSA